MNSRSFRSLPKITAAAAILLALGAGCKPGNDAAAAAQLDQGAQPVAASDGGAPAHDPVMTMTGGTQFSESDRILLDSAIAACRENDPHGFFTAFASSAEVRRRFSAPTIDYSTVRLGADYRVLRQERVAAASYRDFPIKMVDYYFMSARPVSPGDEREYVMREINQSQSDQLSVEWTRVHFDGKSEGGDDLGNAFTLDGRPYEKGSSPTDGQLLFEPSGNCWRLVADIRHSHGEH